jgi:hypothetical protein
MNRPTSSVAVGVTALFILAGCNSGMNSGSTPGPSTPQRGQLLTNPPTLVATFGISDLLGLLGLDSLGKELLTLAYSDAFEAAVTAVEVAAIAGGATDRGQAAVLGDYHAQIVPPFCLAAVKSFFDGQGG